MVNWIGIVKCVVCGELATQLDMGGRPICDKKSCIEQRTKEINEYTAEFDKIYKK